MKKKFISVLLLIALCFSLSAPAYADSTTTFIQATNDLLSSIAHATMHYAGLGIISDAISAADWSTYASNNFASWLAGAGGVLADVTDLAWDGVRNRFILGSGVATLINQYINSFVTDNNITSGETSVTASLPFPVVSSLPDFTTSEYFDASYPNPHALHNYNIWVAFRNSANVYTVYHIHGSSVDIYGNDGSFVRTDTIENANTLVFYRCSSDGTFCGNFALMFDTGAQYSPFGKAVYSGGWLSTSFEYYRYKDFTTSIPSLSSFENTLSSLVPSSPSSEQVISIPSSVSSPSDFSSAVYSGLSGNSLSDIGIDISVGSSDPEPTDPPIIDDALPQDIPNFAGRINDIVDGIGGVTDTTPDNIFTRSGEKIHNWIEGLWDSFKTWLQQLLNSLSSAFLTIWDNITSVLDDILDFLLGLFGVDNDFQDEFGGLIDGLSFGSIWHYVTSWIASISAFLGLLLSVWGNLPAAMSIIVWASIALVIIFGVYHRFIS